MRLEFTSASVFLMYFDNQALGKVDLVFLNFLIMETSPSFSCGGSTYLFYECVMLSV